MKNLIIFILCFLFLLIKVEKKAFCQNLEIDSIRISLNLIPNDTAKVLELTNFSYRYLKYQIDTALVYGRKALLLSQKLNYKYGQASSLNQLGLVHKYLTNFDSSLNYYNKSYFLFDSLHVDSEKASVLNRMGNIYKRFGDFNKSLDCFLNSLKIYQNKNDSIHMSDILNNLGVLYNNMGNFDKSLKYYFLNLDVRKKTNQINNIHIVYMNIANVYDQKGDFIKATEYYKQALDYLTDTNNKYDRLLLLHNIGTNYEVTGKYSEAKSYYLKAISLEKEINEKEMLVFSMQGLGNTHIKQGNRKTGLKYLKESYDLANQINDVRKQHNLARNLYIEYEKIGDYKKAFSYLKDYIVFEDSIFSSEKKKQIIELEQKYESEKRQQQISLLEKEKEIQSLELTKAELDSKQKSFQRNILVLISLIAFAFILYMGYENIRRKRLNNILKKQNNQITHQQTQIIKQNNELVDANKTKDKLFQIIAHDLRSPLVSIDNLAQLIPYWIDEQDFESMNKLSETLEISTKNLLSLIDNLLNWALSQQGQFPFKPEEMDLSEIGKEILEIYKPIADLKKIQIICEMCNNSHVFADRNMVSAIIRNLLNNAIKFTPESGTITIGSSIENEIAHVWVKDNGIGFTPENQEKIFNIIHETSNGTCGETGKGLGLFFCKEFVSMNKGDIFIDSQLNKGTKITFTLPSRDISQN